MNQATKKGLVGFLLAVLAAFGIYFQPKPLPTPPPAATPAPAPTERPSPVPSPSALPSQAPEPVNVCNYPPSDGACVFDPDGEGRFEAAVYRAREQAKAEGYLTPDGRVKDERTYTNALARILQTNGVCAVNGKAMSSDPNISMDAKQILTALIEHQRDRAEACRPAGQEI